jgi:hypothetical protein
MEQAEHNRTVTHINHLESEPLFPLPHRTPAINYGFLFHVRGRPFFISPFFKEFLFFPSQTGEERHT